MRTQITFYLDDELQGSDRANLETHLSECETCREIYDSEKQFLETIRGSRPLYNAAPELRTRVVSVLGGEAPSTLPASAELRRRVRVAFWKLSRGSSGVFSARRVMAVATILALAFAIGIWRFTGFKPRRPTSEFAMMAVDTHQRHLRNQLPLEIASDQPEEISRWFTGKVPFSVQLPNYQESSGQEKLYNLEGARLVGYKNDYAAYVAYEMRTRPISLVVTSDRVAQPSGGEEIVSQGITFHYDSIEGLKVISWSDRGLTYALVSDLEERGQESCIVCHQGTKDKDFIESLKPR
ncbi:MAG TPA: zf-HC2 domain-containing protein [Blastocatellia bacterium]|nr:zf-HC2 domain-containing protein [Blastocatellia bacterium]